MAMVHIGVTLRSQDLNSELWIFRDVSHPEIQYELLSFLKMMFTTKIES